MSDMLQRLWTGSGKHSSEEELLRLIDGELGRWRVGRVQRHIERCWACRSRYEQVQGTIFEFVEYRKRMVAPHLPLGNSPRDQFLRRLDEVSHEIPTPWPVRAAYYLRSTTAVMMNPIVATVLIAVAVAAAVFLVSQRNLPTVSAKELLERAQVWDTNPATGTREGAVHQKVEIRTPTATFQRSLYRDIQGRRRPRKLDNSPVQMKLQLALKSGGVDLERPLSATDFRQWNEHLSEKKDQVFSDRQGTLTLRTTTNSSDVEEESLTVRNADFRPIARRILLRDVGEVDISELNYDVLSWNEVNSAELFEPESGAPTLGRPLLALPSPAALDEAELRARLALSEIGADTGENISIAQTSTSVSVTGFVETQPRKREIDQALMRLPLVRTSVSTFEVRTRQFAGPEPAPGHVSQEAVAALGSPLEIYLAGRSVPVEQAVRLSRDLFDETLEIDRQSLVLDSLEKRYPPSARSGFTSGNEALFQQLFGRHLSTLNAAIDKERRLLSGYVGAPSETQPAAEGHTAADLLRSATEARRLAGELLAHGKDGQRPGDVILTELAGSLRSCQRIAESMGRDKQE